MFDKIFVIRKGFIMVIMIIIILFDFGTVGSQALLLTMLIAETYNIMCNYQWMFFFHP